MQKLLNVTFLAISLAIMSLAQAETSQNDSTETTGQYASASLITGKVKSALLAQKNIDSTKINVQSEMTSNHKTIVILTGTQKTQLQIDTAGVIAKNVEGVTKVINKLSISTE